MVPYHMEAYHIDNIIWTPQHATFWNFVILQRTAHSKAQAY